MSVDFGGPATEIFQILRSFNYEVVLFDENGNSVYEPEDARRFFCKPTNMLVSIVDDGDNSSLRLYIGQSSEIEQLRGLIDTLRNTAPKYNMLFNVRRYDRILSPKDFSSQHSVQEAIGDRMKKAPEKWDPKRDAPQKVGITSIEKVTEMKVFEGMYGTTRSSYIKLENARMIVRHSARVNEDLIGSRGRNIQAIFVENAIGERTLFPINNLSGARAMTQHVNQGGSFADPVGSQILQMAEDNANMATVSRHIQAHGGSLNEAAFDVRKNVREAMSETRRMFERMFRPGGYTAEAAKINERANTLVEDGDEDINEYAEQVKDLRGLLTVEGVELKENVLQSVARSLHEMQAKVEEGRRPVVPMIRVIGREVSKDAWDAFKCGHLDLYRKPEVKISAKLDRTAELVTKLGAIAGVTKDDTLANLFSYISDALVHKQKNPENQLHDLRRIGVHALKAAHMPIGEGMALTSPVIKEFNEWLDGHSIEAVLITETVRLGTPQTITFESDLGGKNVSVTVTNHPATANETPDAGSQSSASLSFDNIMTEDGQRIDPQTLDPMMQRNLHEQAIRELAMRVGDDDFQQSVGEDINEAGNEEILWRDEDHSETMDGPMGKPIHMDQRGWPKGTETWAEPDQEPDVEEGMMSPQSGSAPSVGAPGLNQGGMESFEGMMSLPQSGTGPEVGAGGDQEISFGGCSDELTPDDVILPTNMGKDLQGEVRKHTTMGDNGEQVPVDPAYITRLTQLAGMNRY